jgi:hypothetical protein
VDLNGSRPSVWLRSWRCRCTRHSPRYRGRICTGYLRCAGCSLHLSG